MRKGGTAVILTPHATNFPLFAKPGNFISLSQHATSCTCACGIALILYLIFQPCASRLRTQCY